tara:strand:- start:40 stop:612 length:573 start_codon:yes stop_codon:yes gene_type:complete
MKLQLEDLPNEFWADALGYDGIYEVSSLGRLKSLGRWVCNGKSDRWVKDRILKQGRSKDGRMTAIFSVGNITYSQNVSELIYLSFNREDDVNGFVIAHLNKIVFDNRLANLKKMTIKDSRKISELLGNLKPMPVRGILKYTANNTIIKNDCITDKKCKKCNEFKEIKRFEKSRNTCLNCRGSIRKQTNKK